MYARIHTTHQMPDRPEHHRPADAIAALPGFAGSYDLRQTDGTGRRVISMWTTEEEARASADHTPERLGPPSVDPATDLIYQVRDDLAGVAAADAPTHATMRFWSGPMSEQEAARGAQLRRERFAPAVLAVDGVVRMIAFFQPDTREPCLLTLTTSAESSEAAGTVGRAIPLNAEEKIRFTPVRTEYFTVGAGIVAPTGLAEQRG
ncbi:MAG: hypothetical protein AB7J32_14820 [Pseudonocardia sp.]